MFHQNGHQTIEYMSYGRKESTEAEAIKFDRAPCPSEGIVKYKDAFL